MNGSDLNEWLEANLKPAQRTRYLDRPIPDLPSPEVQKRFTGRDGRPNLSQAFEYWKLMWHDIDTDPRTKVLDFGCGWGRIGRFWLLDLEPHQVFFADCLSDAIKTFSSLNNPCIFEHCGTRPPLKQRGPFDVISAYSVFSHLNEEHFNLWLSEFHEILKPHGKLYVTSRGEEFIDVVERWQQAGRKGAFNAHMLPTAVELRSRYNKGLFQFYTKSGGGSELAASFYGQAFVPETYVRAAALRIGYSSAERIPSPPGVDQAVFLLTK
jgi:SAM-dependent methyltransferase